MIFICIKDTRSKNIEATFREYPKTSAHISFGAAQTRSSFGGNSRTLAHTSFNGSYMY